MRVTLPKFLPNVGYGHVYLVRGFHRLPDGRTLDAEPLHPGMELDLPEGSVVVYLETFPLGCRLGRTGACQLRVYQISVDGPRLAHCSGRLPGHIDWVAAIEPVVRTLLTS